MRRVAVSSVANSLFCTSTSAPDSALATRLADVRVSYERYLELPSPRLALRGARFLYCLEPVVKVRNLLLDEPPVNLELFLARSFCADAATCWEKCVHACVRRGYSVFI